MTPWCSIPVRSRPLHCTGALFALTWVGVALFPSGHVLCAGEPEQNTPTTTSEHYGRTPDTVIPYRDFREPYVRYFQDIPAFRGAGRNAQANPPLESVRIGVLAPGGSAPDADLGRDMVDGITLAIDQANGAGGYHGIPFKIVHRQDSGAWGSSANEIVAFKFQDHVLAVLGSIDGANTHIALRVALKAQIPMLNTATTDPTLTETAIPWIMRCMADDRQQGYALAHHIFSECGIGKVAAFRVNDRYGRTGIAEFRDAARRLRHPLSVELRWNRGERNFGEQLDRIARTKAEAVVLWGNASDTAAVVREMRQRGMSQRVFGCDRLVSERFLTEAGAAAEGVVAVATFNPKEPNPRYTTFKTAFQERFGRRPGTFAAHGYDGANILIEAIRKGGLNAVRVRDALYEYRHYDGVTGRIEFDTTLNDIGSVYIATVNEGSYSYRRSDFAKRTSEVRGPVPYRTLADSAPAVRVSRSAATDKAPKTLRIGCFLPLDKVGRSAVRGLKMALAEDEAARPEGIAIELLVRDSRGVWGDNSGSLTGLVADQNVLALVGSTERRGTHLMETLAARLHIPMITLCGDDPTIHAIPLPWVFSVAPAGVAPDEVFAARFASRFDTEATDAAAMGYDAGTLLIGAIRAGRTSRTELREELVASRCDGCASGSFRFDAWGRRIEQIDSRSTAVFGSENGTAFVSHIGHDGEGSP